MIDFAARDAEYRAALGLTSEDPIPNRLGQCSGHAPSIHRNGHRPSDAKLNPDVRQVTGYHAPEPPPGVDLGSCDIELRSRRRSVAARAVPRGDVDAQLGEYAEAITYAEAARDLALNEPARKAASRYVTRLNDRRDALVRAARIDASR